MSGKERAEISPGGLFDWGRRTFIMGVLNVTPDSFSDGGLYLEPGAALARARQMVDEGADLIDVGGESTRPGFARVGVEEELARVLPVIRALASELPVPLSVDTSKAKVAAAALEAGASIVNDVSSLSDPDMIPVVARAGAGLVIMHNQAEAVYRDLVEDITGFLRDAAARVEKGGVRPDRIILDPGFGFAKTVEHNLEVVRRLGEFRRLGKPLLLGPSRKSTIGHVLSLPPDQRVEGTASLVAIAVAGGADMVRVHDVKEMVRVVRMADAVVRPSTMKVVPGATSVWRRICLRGLRLEGCHGVFPEEKQQVQPFFVDVDLELGQHREGPADSLRATVDYTDVCRSVAEVVRKGPGEGYDLIETLAEAIASKLLRDFPLMGVVVRVHKPEAPLGGFFEDLFVEVRRGVG